MSLKTDLIAARALIDTPEKWCKDAQSYTTSGEVTTFDDVGACSWCAAAAIAVHASDFDARVEAYGLLAEAVGIPADESWRLVDWNNAPERTHADVLDAFDTAIAWA